MARKNEQPADEGPWTPLLDILDDVRDFGQPKPPAEQDDKQPTDDEQIILWILERAPEDEDEDAVAEWIDESMAEHRDNIRRAKERFDGYRHGLGLDIDEHKED